MLGTDVAMCMLSNEQYLLSKKLSSRRLNFKTKNLL